MIPKVGEREHDYRDYLLEGKLSHPGVPPACSLGSVSPALAGMLAARFQVGEPVGATGEPRSHMGSWLPQPRFPLPGCWQVAPSGTRGRWQGHSTPSQVPALPPCSLSLQEVIPKDDSLPLADGYWGSKSLRPDQGVGWVVKTLGAWSPSTLQESRRTCVLQNPCSFPTLLPAASTGG